MSFCNFNSKSDGRRYDFFSFKYSSSLSTSESRAKPPLLDSFECFFDPQRSFGNPLRTFWQSFASPVLEISMQAILTSTLFQFFVVLCFSFLLLFSFLFCRLGLWAKGYGNRGAMVISISRSRIFFLKTEQVLS